MRIGILSPSIYMYQKLYSKRVYAPGKLAMDLADGLVEAGHEVFFFTAPDVPTKATIIPGDVSLLDGSFCLDYQQDLSPELNEIVTLYETKKYYELGLTQEAFLYAQQNNLDILHVYHAFGNIAHYFDALQIVPTVYTLHVLPPPDNTLEFWRYKKFSDQAFVAISKRQEEGFKSSFSTINIPAVVYHGLSLGEYPFSATSKSYLAFIGRLVPEKGLDKALSIIQKTGDILKIATHINPVVEKSEYYQKSILPLLKDSKSEMVGFLSGSEKARFLGNAKAFLFPLQWEEPFGVVLIESLAVGTPVIAYSRGSIPEIITDGETGYLVDPEKGEEGMIEAIQKLHCLSKEEYFAMRKRCREVAEKRFSVEVMVKEHEVVYQKLITRYKERYFA